MDNNNLPKIVKRGYNQNGKLTSITIRIKSEILPFTIGQLAGWYKNGKLSSNS